MFRSVVVVLAVTGSAIAQSINTPASLVQCQPAQITFSGGTAPYIIDVIPGGQVSAAAIENLQSSITTSPYTWNVNLASGTNITLKLTDSTGAIGYSSPLVIQAGSSSACLNASASTSGVATGAVTTTALSASGTASGTTSAVMSMSTTSLTSAAAASSARASTAASSAAAVTSAAASAATSAASAAASTAAAATSSAAAAATSAKSGAMPTAMIGAGGVVAAIVGGIAMLF